MTPNAAAALERLIARIDKVGDDLLNPEDESSPYELATELHNVSAELRASLAQQTEAVAWRFLDEDGKPTSKWAGIDAKPMHYWQGNLRDGAYPGTSIEYAYSHPAAVDEATRAWLEAANAHADAVRAYNDHLTYVREHCPLGTSVDAQYQAMCAAEKKARSLLEPMRVALTAALQPATSDGEKA